VKKKSKSIFGPVDYSGGAPDGYVCSTCCAIGCKLWREYSKFLENQVLRCIDCAGKNQKKDVSNVDELGRIPWEYGHGAIQMTDEIGWLVPAIPTEDGITYWGYSSTPETGVDWWRRLPTRPVRNPQEVQMKSTTEVFGKVSGHICQRVSMSMNENEGEGDYATELNFTLTHTEAWDLIEVISRSIKRCAVRSDADFEEGYINFSLICMADISSLKKDGSWISVQEDAAIGETAKPEK